MPDQETEAKPGFQGSQHTTVEATIYTQAGDPIILTGAGERDAIIPLDGRDASDDHPSLTAATTEKTLGAASGTWSLMMKPSRVAKQLFDQVVDDDWVDIVFKQHNRQWHVMRGLVDNPRRRKVVSGRGATTETFTLTGRDFGKIFEVTPIWFSVLIDESSGITGGVSLKVFGGMPNVYGSPDETVEGFLLGFLDQLSGVGRAVWKMPDTMPGVQDEFVRNVAFNRDDFTADPRRVAINANYMMPEGTLWQLAQQWSDPEFCELFLDTVPLNFYDDPLAEIDPKDNSMVIRFRDRPFPTTALADSSPYFKLPLFNIPRQAIVGHDVGRSGMERFNAFFVAPQLAQEVIQAGGIDLYLPEWDAGDILRHGLRRFDVNSQYAAANADYLTLSRAQRAQMRDWHCLNPYLSNGTLDLSVGMPWVRIGTRVRIPGIESEDQDETYYVESVAHSWNFGVGTRTNLGVTRGWIGTDSSLIDALGIVAGNYTEPTRAQP